MIGEDEAGCARCDQLYRRVTKMVEGVDQTELIAVLMTIVSEAISEVEDPKEWLEFIITQLVVQLQCERMRMSVEGMRMQ